MEGQLRLMSTELTQVKTLLSQVSNTVLAQKQAMENMETTMKSMHSSSASASGAKAKGKKKK